jgi:hypothetical protein
MPGQRLMPMDALFAITRNLDAHKTAGAGKWAQQCVAYVHYFHKPQNHTKPDII